MSTQHVNFSLWACLFWLPIAPCSLSSCLRESDYYKAMQMLLEELGGLPNTLAWRRGEVCCSSHIGHLYTEESTCAYKDMCLGWYTIKNHYLTVTDNKVNLAYISFLSLKKISSTTSVPSSPRVATRRRRGREQKMRKPLLPSAQRWVQHQLGPRQMLKNRRGPACQRVARPTRTSPRVWRGCARRRPAPRLGTGGTGGRRPVRWAAPALWCPSWPHVSCQSPSLQWKPGTVGPALTLTAACCLTVKCASFHALHLLLSDQVRFRNA